MSHEVLIQVDIGLASGLVFGCLHNVSQEQSGIDSGEK
jgi:hypothetical protein